MIEAIRNAFKVRDLRKKILFTLFILLVYRFGAHIPVPGVDIGAIQKLFSSKEAGILGFIDLFTGGALSRFAIFALGIMPYITSSIIMQLLTVVIPKLEEWQKEGEVGQRKVTQVTRYLTLVLAIVEASGYTLLFQSQLGTPFSVLDKYLIVITLTAGTALIMWLGELITQRGIGNGMSLLIFASIISRMPQAVYDTFRVINPAVAIAFFLLLGAIMVAIIVMEKGQRRIPVQYAKRVVGRKMYSGGSTYIPLKINSAGVIPIIFASSVLLFPATIGKFSGRFTSVVNALSAGSVYRMIFEAILIVFFAYFYTAIVFNPIEISDNIKKYGGFVPGVRPGRPTAIHLDKVLNRITLPGALFLASIAILPDVLGARLGIPFFAQNFGGTSLLIVVGVALETMMQLESQLLQRHYEGFLK
ncbi:MAG: preprotein translocase subunit SecY [Actinomycetota bacterium]|nr:preprotein translocase subunit SecY [Actinomycetota bacterium]